MRRLLLLSLALTAGCNSILDIPERSLLVDEETGVRVDSMPDLSVDEDTALIDSTVDETIDSSVSETTADALPDTTLTDSALADSAPDSAPDSAVTDSAVTDSAVTDSADTATPDTADTAMPDTTPIDMGIDAPSCGVTGTPCCGAVAATCNTNAACGSGACVTAATACVRASDCPGVCTGPSLCGSNICFKCSTSSGTVALGGACTSSGQCTSGPCDRIRGVCTVACANAITGDADCTALARGLCTVTNSSVTSGGTTATGKLGYCARGCNREADCLAGEVCRGSSNDVADRIDITCAPPRTGATGDVGATCVTSDDCKGGICLTSTSGSTTTKQCTSFCATAADCTGTWKTCGSVDFTRPVSGGLQPVKVCTP